MTSESILGVAEYYWATSDPVSSWQHEFSQVWTMLFGASPIPPIYEPRMQSKIVEPFISMRRCKPFLGHKFRIGGNN